MLEAVKIMLLPGNGTLTLDSTAIPAEDLPKEVTKAEIDDNKLKYAPPEDANGNNYTTFQFKVNDGAAGTASAYTMTINVDSVPDVTQVAITSTPTSGTTPKKYAGGEKIQVTVTFDEAVTLTGDPVINLEVGTNSRPSAYGSGSTMTPLVFEYTVMAGQQHRGHHSQRPCGAEQPQGGRQPDAAGHHRAVGERGGGEGDRAEEVSH
ncbi:hypothetical protein [Candidatus Synechococcus spongiarum]|uniref:Uncharacterized protein n=1 Tax=Candidatus Synechococcus spongiarum TaxID=431041 RepID=A0A170T3R2_9SYNE|nr:hypothetical protein [Candidatus Synechococcus spongiarum]CZB11090.1 hypothetical protein FLM9_74 [Candidatus Synechococcus spongiarum]